MINWIKKNLINIEVSFEYFTNRSVASITASLQKTVNDLEAHAADMVKLAAVKEQQIAKAARERGEHLDEHLKASQVAYKIGSLLG